MRPATSCLIAVATLVGELSAQDALFQWTGAAANQQVGRIVDELGDVDGDGALDVIVADAKRVTIRTGHSGSLIAAIPVAAFDAAGVGDVDLDGVPDLMIQYTVYSGATFAPIGTATPSSPGTLWNSIRDIDGPGDVNLDGHADLLVGTPHESQPTPECGAVRLYSGQTLAQIHISAGFFVEDYYGFHVSGTGDVNGDGHPDFAASTDYVGGNSRVYSGKDGALLHSYGQGLPGNAPASGVDDVNGDGFADYAVAASSGVDVAVHSGKDGTLLFGIQLGATQGFLYLSRVGDVDGDGFADVVVADSNFSDLAPKVGRIVAYSGATSAFLYEVVGQFPHGYFGSKLEGVRDVDGDGRADFAVGARESDVGGIQNAGLAAVISGEPCGDITNYGHGCAGSGFIRPDLRVKGCTVFGGTLEVSIEEGLGGAVGWIVLGAAPAALPISAGCTLNVSLPLIASLPIALGGSGPGAGAIAFAATIPAAGPAGEISLQAFLSDPGAPAGFSNTNGVRLKIVP
jgi:hypothetical protein